MKIVRLTVQNYKSFHKPPELNFAPEMNLITGANNVGKSALIEVLSSRFDGNPHRSVLTMPHEGDQPPQLSTVDLVLRIGVDETQRLLSNKSLYFTVPELTPAVINSGVRGYSSDYLKRFAEEWIFNRTDFLYELQLRRGVGSSGISIPDSPMSSVYPGMKVQPNQGRTVFSVTFASGVLQVGSASQGGHEDIGVAFFHELVAQTYKFNAERFNIGVSPVGTSRVLNPDASNLPEVLDNLKENPARFEEYVALVREVLPPVKGISLRPVQTNRVEILIWLVDPRSKRIDLAIPLAQCGTGIGQVLSILYVVTTSLTPKTLCVDEPQSFLHPGAARKLIEILKRHRQHQYFITTHSPTVITTAGTVPMTLLTANEGVTTIEQLDPSAADSMRRSLLELGARLADVFGADNVLWVEGPTEELCFPKIVERVLGRSILGTAIVAVARTGDLEGRNAERVLRIYNRLARANHMIPPALAFLIDRECRSNDEMLELKRLNEGKTFFLKRRMLENYLLNPDAIVAVVNEIEGFSPRPITTDLVNAVLEKSKSIAGLYCNKKINQPQWMTDIHAAEVLAEVFRNLSENRVEFRKTTHSVAILDWIIVNSPDDITELSSSLAEALQVSS